MAQPVTQQAPQGPPPETFPAPTNHLNAEVLVPVNDPTYNAYIHANRQRAWSLIRSDDLSRYNWDMRSHDNARPNEGPPAVPSATDPNPLPTQIPNDDVHDDADEDDDEILDLGDSMHAVSLSDSSAPSCPFQHINKHAGSPNFMGCPFLRSLGYDPGKLLAFHNYPLAFKFYADSIRHHPDVLPMDMSYFDFVKQLDSIAHPVDLPPSSAYSKARGLDLMSVLPSTTWEDGETLDAFASTLFVTASGLPGRKPALARPVPSLRSTAYYDNLHGRCHYSSYYVDPMAILNHFDTNIASSLLATLLCPSRNTAFNKANGHAYVAQERNLTVSEFIRQWYTRYQLGRVREDIETTREARARNLGYDEDLWVSISNEAAYVHNWVRPKKITRPANADCRKFDIQGIPWSTTLKTRRGHAREIRDNTYKSYHNIARYSQQYTCGMPSSENFYIPKAMYTEYKASMEHFQLRNLISATASNTVHYARDSKVYTATPFYDEQHCIIDLSNPRGSRPFSEPVRITTLKAKHGVTVVGGFEGEYAYRGEITGHALKEGYITSAGGIVTHVDILKNRTSDIPNAIITTNDSVLHVLDCEKETFIDRQLFASPINCTDTSPDGNLRVIVGDARSAWVIDSAGKPVRELVGHDDFGFACAWSPDSIHVATANQDCTVNIWDVRMWRRLVTIDSDVACYRSLRYSPLGSGPSTLLMCEPADRVVLLNAHDYRTRQVHDFFGEIGGADFTPDGGRIWVANIDPEFGGLIEYERSSRYMPFY